jgi:hypothetical protein
VDKVVDKDLLTAPKASIGAGSNKLPVPKALFYSNEINDLESQPAASEFIFPIF